ASVRSAEPHQSPKSRRGLILQPLPLLPGNPVGHPVDSVLLYLVVQHDQIRVDVRSQIFAEMAVYSHQNRTSPNKRFDVPPPTRSMVKNRLGNSIRQFCFTPKISHNSFFIRLWGSGPTARPRGHPYVYVFQDRKSTRLNSSHVKISYAVFCLKNINKP